jgi:hypothetical protein
MQIILLVWVILTLLSVLFGLLIVRELRTQRGELAAAPTRPREFKEQYELRPLRMTELGAEDGHNGYGSG